MWVLLRQDSERDLDFGLALDARTSNQQAVDSNRHCSDTDISSPQDSEGDLDFGLALDARPTTVVGGKVMQRGGPDTAGAIDFLSF